VVKYEAKANHDDLHEEKGVYESQFLLATPVGGGIIVVKVQL
jgi:hypothetical protein